MVSLRGAGGVRGSIYYRLLVVLRRGRLARRGVARRGDARGERPAFEGAGPVGSRGSALGPGSVMICFFDRHGFSAHFVTSFSHQPATAAGAIPEQFGTSVSTRQPVAPRGRAAIGRRRVRRESSRGAAAKPGCWRARAAPRRLVRCATAPLLEPPPPRAGATGKNRPAKKKNSRDNARRRQEQAQVRA